MDIIELFKGIIITDHAKTAQYEIADHLRKNGYDVELEYPISNRGDGRGGRIDIVATNQSDKLAIEVDRSSPRLKSMEKLKSMDGYVKIVLLRNGNYKFMREGVLIYSLNIEERK